MLMMVYGGDDGGGDNDGDDNGGCDGNDKDE